MTTQMKPVATRRHPVGAELLPSGGVHFRVWAPRRQSVDVEIDGEHTALDRDTHGYFAGLVTDAGAGTRYRFRLDGDRSFPDPASRFQPEGPHGPSEVVDASRFVWTDGDWRGIGPRGQIIYELHIGTFTPQGTFASAAMRLPELASLGVTVLEVMPIAEFPGKYGWGYDGVDWFAPFHGYGTPDDFRRFVDRAHAEGLGVILDVVYNHFGPDGNYLREFSDTYFNHDRTTDWGDAINFDGPGSGPVRELVLSNVRYWISEFHLDGLRLDATDNIYDDSGTHLLEAIGVTARETAGDRPIILVAENEQQRSQLVRSRNRKGFGLDMLWNDDYHHSALVAATGLREAYLTDYSGKARELLAAMKHGYLYQGQHYSWQKQRRGTSSLDIAPHQFIHFIENHDQIANSRDGRRLHQLTSPGRYRALTALTILGPQTPMLFQGAEFGSTAPFLYFADHAPDLAKMVRKGRGEFLAQFPSLKDPDVQATLADPGDPRTFEQSRLDWSERHQHREHLALHQDLITLKRCDPVLSHDEVRIDGAVLSDDAFLIRFFAPGEADRLLVINLGTELAHDTPSEPLLAPIDRESGWQRLWHSEDPCYGGRGASRIESELGAWRIPAESATLLTAES